LVVRTSAAQVAGGVIHFSTDPHAQGEGGHVLLNIVVVTAGEYIIGAHVFTRNGAGAVTCCSQIGLVVIHGDVSKAKLGDLATRGIGGGNSAIHHWGCF
jgi:hypothetical protein